MTLTKDYLNSIFEYRDGDLYYRHSRGAAKAGSKAGCKRKDGVSNIQINKKIYLLHRIVFMMHHGYLPEMVDHIDLNRSNNRIENLRAAKHAENAWNANARVDSTSNIKNVTFNARRRKWLVRIQANGNRMHIGCYKDLELAELVAMEARNKYHGNFARHNTMTAEQTKDFIKELP
jgi:hypothetical protein